MISDDVKSKLSAQEIAFLESAVKEAKSSSDGVVGMGPTVINGKLPMSPPTSRKIVQKLADLDLVTIVRWTGVIGGPTFRIAPELLKD